MRGCLEGGNGDGNLFLLFFMSTVMILNAMKIVRYNETFNADVCILLPRAHIFREAPIAGCKG